MTNSDVKLNHGDEYIVFYTGGPYDGRTDTRVATDFGIDESLTVLVAFEGKETQVVYANPEIKKLGDQVQVHYTWDAAHGEPLEDLDERRD